MNTTPDGDFQTYKAESGAFVREHFFGRDPRTAAMVEHLSDSRDLGPQARRTRLSQAVRRLPGRDRAHRVSRRSILAKTIKGWTLGSHFEGRNSTHQMKKLTLEDLKAFRDRLFLEIPDSSARRGSAALLPAAEGLTGAGVPARAAARSWAATCPHRSVARASLLAAARRGGVRGRRGAARAGRRSPPPWRSSGCSRT